MGNIYVISYASSYYYASQKRLCNSAKAYKYKTISYTDKWLRKTEFYKKNKTILDQRRGAGYWLWKPYILLETFKNIKKEDFVIYIDSDAVIINPLDPLIEICRKNKGLMLFDNSVHVNKSWIKRDCFILMEADSDMYYEAGQSMGGFMVMQKNDFTTEFLNEWLEYARDHRILTDSPNELGKPNLPDFIEHRHDQAILSIMYIKKNLELFRDPSQFGNPYKQEAFRVNGEYLAEGKYADNDIIKMNSPYNTLIKLSDPVKKTYPSIIKYPKKIIKKIIRINA